MHSRLDRIETELGILAPRVADEAHALESMIRERERVRLGLMLIEQRDQFLAKRTETEKSKRSKEGKPVLDAAPSPAHQFAQVVSEVLKSWHFPGECHVSFDEKQFDIKIDGKPRVNNGKGVRALTHAAFKIALLIYCHERQSASASRVGHPRHAPLNLQRPSSDS
jgi:Rad3-related DNA helicase